LCGCTGGWRVVLRATGATVTPRGGCRYGSLFRGKLALCREALKVGHEAQAQWVLDVHALHGDQIAGYLGGAFSKPDVVVVYREFVRVVRQSVHTCGTQETDSYNTKGCTIPWKLCSFKPKSSSHADRIVRIFHSLTNFMHYLPQNRTRLLSMAVML
jgi:hypothetical protein